MVIHKGKEGSCLEEPCTAALSFLHFTWNLEHQISIFLEFISLLCLTLVGKTDTWQLNLILGIMNISAEPLLRSTLLEKAEEQQWETLSDTKAMNN